MIWSDEVGTKLQLYDASERSFNLVHFTGRGTLTMQMPQCQHREARIDRFMAAQLAQVFDHFALYAKLPVSFPEPDFMI